MRLLCRWLLLLCGIALVCLRLYPTGQEWVSKLFHDDFVYAQANSFSLHLIRESGLSLDLYESYADNLTNLTHTTTVILEAAVIFIVSFVVARKLR